MRVAVPLVLALLLVGCSAPPTSTTTSETEALVAGVSAQRLPDPGQDFSNVIVSDHGVPGGHSVRSLHEGLIHGVEVVGWNDLTDKLPPGAIGTGWSAAGIWQDYMCVAQFAGTGSIAIVNIKDPANPVVEAQVADAQVNGDCQFTDDGAYMFAGAYIGSGTDPESPEGSQTPAEGSSDGINVWDVSDKTRPVHILHSRTGTYHTLLLHRDPDDGVTYLIQAYNGTIYAFDPTTPALSPVAQITPMKHDMWVAKHPITKQWLLYSGAGDGTVIYSFDDPANPVELATWAPEDGIEGQQGWHRQASSDLLIDGKAIIVVAGETCGSGNTLPYTVLDVTDPTSPIALGTWEIPGKPISTDRVHLCDFSPHEFSLYDGYVASGNYHAGVWVFDIGSAERLANPVTIGYYLPDKEPLLEGHPQNLDGPWNPFVWGAFFDDDGYIWVGDFTSGLYSLRIPGVTKEI